nr:DUF1801 domain-containing protein [Flavobacterium sp. N503310]
MEPASENKGMWKYSGQWEEELLLLKAIIDKTELKETTKWGGPVYVYEKKNVIGLGGFKDYFAIWFLMVFS